MSICLEVFETFFKKPCFYLVFPFSHSFNQLLGCINLLLTMFWVSLLYALCCNGLLHRFNLLHACFMVFFIFSFCLNRLHYVLINYILIDYLYHFLVLGVN